MTAVEFLVKEFSDILGTLDIKPMQDLLLVDAIKRAKEMEKQQIVEAYDEAEGKIIGKGEQYYNKTFKNTKK
jgi:hypothetical protein